MNETSKTLERLKRDGYFEKYLKGRGLDIGCGNDPLPGAEPWDTPQGDAQYLEGVLPHTYDFIYSSHCLEHMVDPYIALWNWWKVLKPGGHLVVVVPDEDLYEQGAWPSFWNGDHKHTFTPYKTTSWCKDSVNLVDLVMCICEDEPGKLISLKIIDEGYDYSLQPTFGDDLTFTWVDQTFTGAQAAVEFIVKKLKDPSDTDRFENCTV